MKRRKLLFIKQNLSHDFIAYIEVTAVHKCIIYFVSYWHQEDIGRTFIFTKNIVNT